MGGPTLLPAQDPLPKPASSSKLRVSMPGKSSAKDFPQSHRTRSDFSRTRLQNGKGKPAPLNTHPFRPPTRFPEQLPLIQTQRDSDAEQEDPELEDPELESEGVQTPAPQQSEKHPSILKLESATPKHTSHNVRFDDPSPTATGEAEETDQVPCSPFSSETEWKGEPEECHKGSMPLGFLLCL
jgi:hypothetical protein